jgi:membrane fusion protein (multidrug efflux system)
MTENVSELETRPTEPKQNEKQDLAPRKDDDPPHLNVVESKHREEQEVAKLPAPLPRWPLVVAGLVVAIFAAVVLYIIFRPRPDVWTDDAYVMVHYATIAPRISGQVAMVPVDDNEVVKTGQVLATLDPRDYETALASAEAAVARDRSVLDEISANLSRQPSII